jgi:hypothetical protein
MTLTEGRIDVSKFETVPKRRRSMHADGKSKFANGWPAAILTFGVALTVIWAGVLILISLKYLHLL